jgi:lipopolysaccharide transport system permease protein
VAAAARRPGPEVGLGYPGNEMRAHEFNGSPDAVRSSTGEGGTRQLTTPAAVAAATSDVDLATVAAGAGPDNGVVPASARVARIGADEGWTRLVAEVWEHREVLYFLIVRNLKIRYRQTAIGAAWAVVQPLALMVVFVVVAQKILNLSSEGVPYPVFAFAALIPWTLFSGALTLASESVVRDINLVSKVYIPRLLLPISAVGALLVDFLVSFVLLLGMMAVYGIAPEVSALWMIPGLTVLIIALTLALGFLLSALMVRYRDIRSIVPLLVQLFLFATPIAYSITLIPEKWRAVYGLNPMAGPVAGFRSALLGTPAPDGGMLAVSVATTLVLLIVGLAYFVRTDRTFADVI